MTDCYLDTVEGMHYLDEAAVEHRLKRGNFNLEAGEGIWLDVECRYCAKKLTVCFRFESDGVVEIGKSDEDDEND